jgi:TetR/AcrR family transcriptional regulator
MSALRSKTKRPNPGDETPKRILRAAIREFSAHGFSGARTDAIADSAGANKALLYYYFKSKKGLYESSLEEVSETVVEDALAALDARYSAGERLLRTALNHFDRILTKHEFQSLMQQEMVRFRRDESGSMPVLFRAAFHPLMERLREAVEEGIKTGELCKMDWMQVMYSIFGPNVLYFLSAPMMQMALGFDPLSVDGLRSRRKAVVEFLGKALFSDRSHGSKLVRRVLAAMPMPEVKSPPARRREYESA